MATSETTQGSVHQVFSLFFFFLSPHPSPFLVLVSEMSKISTSLHRFRAVFDEMERRVEGMADDFSAMERIVRTMNQRLQPLAIQKIRPNKAQ